MTTTPSISVNLLRLGAAVAASLALACSSSPDTIMAANERQVAVPPPMALSGTAYEAAAMIPLPRVAPGEYPGMENVYRLSDTIISGSEPHDAEALSQIAAWGVKTVLSVDGKMPDVEAAEAAGLRYVHVPIRYSGITDDEVTRIAKTFREAEGPFYVHCYHGKHRGPAAAAIGRVALDGLERERAIAEMRQWCSTAAKYEGLYATVASSEIPSEAQTASYEFDFSSGTKFSGLRDAMIPMARAWDEVILIAKNDWKPSAAHPDIDALQSATQVSQLVNACAAMEETAAYPSDFQEMMAESQQHLGELVGFLTDCRVENTSEYAKNEQLDAAYRAAAATCAKCHKTYRN
ncbi:hypothetical protein Poly30_54390 [Planctomycetes bacterium Poly30]|uniref:Beta-lactamase hydrolase-like protein phosphatase-like domain-containing protein n=1 Tax=Saltatorellus ferox TaxID=2528018 RepID=A0A518F0L3_9BACT|nr:hypothetical protein Poly30_54390 [Planctomycetes bacterium Poly30]